MNPAKFAARVAQSASEYFVPVQVGEDAEELRRRGHMILVVMTVCVLDLVWSAGYQAVHGSPKLAMAAAALVPCALSVAFAMRRGASIRALTQASAILFYVSAVAITWLTGALWPGGIYFLALVPAVSVVLLDREAGLPWMLISLASFGVLAIWTGAPGFEPVISFTEAEIHAGNFRIAVILSLVIGSIASFYAGLYKRTYDSWREEARTVQLAEARFRAISENAHDLIAELDGDGVIIYASPGYEEAIGRSPDRVVGHRLFDVVDPEDLDAALAYWQTLMEKGVVRQRPLRFETGDRGIRWLEVTMRAYQSPEGERRIVAVSRDVTERLEHEKRMRRQDSLATMGTMAAGAAHQLSSPLTSMIASAQFAKLGHGGTLDPVVREMLDRIEDEAARSGQILRSMLSFASEEPSERWIESIHPVIDRAVHAVRDHGDVGAVEIVISRCAGSPMVNMSPIEIEQVFINLIQNSIQAGATVIVIGTVIDAEGTLRATVSDDGCGISEGAREQVFQAFYTSHPGSGSGLGLAIAREIIAEHGGELRILGAGDDGTMMRVELPLAHEEPPPLLQ
ncbi:MAG: nitrogen regulation protein NR(II) [Myxococcota bacterium]